MSTFGAKATKADDRRAVTVRLAESDLETLYWQWRQEMATNALTPIFVEWLSNLLWEQANAIRQGCGAHAAWQAASRAQRAKATQRLWAVPDEALGNVGPRY